jgi:CARDB
VRYRLFLSILIAAATAVALAVAADARRTKASSAKSRTALQVRRCETGGDADHRLVWFHGSMRAVRHTQRMMMRFTLIDRSSGDAVDIPDLAHWRRSHKGVRKFGYTQKVTGLEPGHTYGAKVRYRWVGRHGRKLNAVSRASSDCRQDGELPNLAVKSISARRGLARGTEMYSIVVLNRGGAAAQSVKVDLIVDSASADGAEISELGPGERATVEISGPSCRARVRGVVDPDDEIVESTEDDNSRRTSCPAVAR